MSKIVKIHRANPVVCRVAAIVVLAHALACAPAWDKTLPASSELGSPRGFRIARAITHLHSPISWDACDSKKYDATKCLSDLRSALCMDRIDAAFLTDHMDAMSSTSMTNLLQTQTGDTVVSVSGAPVANQISCGAGATVAPLWIPGYEADPGPAFMGLGIQQQFDPTLATNSTNYNAKDGATAGSVKATTSGLIFAVHSEGWAPGAPNVGSNSLLSTSTGMGGFAVDGMEIYNLHANTDPKIRKPYLGLDYVGGVADLFVYWLDPWGEQQPDLAFLSFLQVAPVYAQIWDTLTTAGQKVTGVGGSDSHENILPFSAHDGDRLDAHRRLLRWFSNHLLVTDLTYASIKAALVGHRSWLAFEGLGTPVGMDFYAKAGTATVGVGDTGTFVAGSTTITVPLPTLHKSSPQDGNAPTIIIRLKQVGANTDTVVATATNASLSYTVTQTGAYRAEIGIIPKHLSAWVGYRRELLNAEYPWIITNHLYLQ